MSSPVEIAAEIAAETVRADSESLAQTRSAKLNMIFAVTLTIFHLGAVAALFFFSWSALIFSLVLWVLAQNVGIAMSYHRLLTHRGYITPKWVEYAMAMCARLALQGGPIYWVGVHRRHHQLTARPGERSLLCFSEPVALGSGGRDCDCVIFYRRVVVVAVGYLFAHHTGAARD